MINAVLKPDYTIEDFEAGAIDAEQFDHEAHVYMGWLYVCKYPLVDAIAKFDAALQRLVIQLEAAGKYHATLTWFFLLLIAERASADEPWLVFKQRNRDLLSGGKEILSRYYSDAYLFSDLARKQFMLPDKLASN